MNEPKIYSVDDIPDDAQVNTGKAKEYTPIDPSEMYQVEVSKAELKDNPFYKPDEIDASKRGSKYQINFEFTILNEGEFEGRKLWRKTSLSLMPITRKGEPTILYKIITAALKRDMSWDECEAFGATVKDLLVNIQDTVVGRQVKVAIENVTDPDTKKVRSQIKTFYPAKEDMAGSAIDLDSVLNEINPQDFTDFAEKGSGEVKRFYEIVTAQGVDPAKAASTLAAHMGKTEIGSVDLLALKAINNKLEKGALFTSLYR